ncbi:hypothetical protein FA13DRAFT_1732808 [Coprinellus micaceus]|uniref:Uncharacterized protein n=1 Tax=Coprinellus micaceus TaxID=71717 RepID=A0A4Y7TBR2_COPMI|nr:hypothetical protein FA13DRAFT_1732808 [Coprinellus micaceus]
MFVFKFSFLLTILAFFMTVTALPVAFGGSQAGAPGSLLGRTYVQRNAAVDIPLAAREDSTPLPAIPREPAADTESFRPVKRSVRFQRRVSTLNRRGVVADMLGTQH